MKLVNTHTLVAYLYTSINISVINKARRECDKTEISNEVSIKIKSSRLISKLRKNRHRALCRKLLIIFIN